MVCCCSSAGAASKPALPRLLVVSGGHPPPWSCETRDADDHEEQQSAPSADRSGDFDGGWHPHELNQRAEICPRLLRQLVTGDRITLPMSTNSLLLLIAGLALLVALGILTN
jgi:hypothetical protein